MTDHIAEVILEVSIQKALDYAIPQELAKSVCVGTWVEVPLRTRTSRGFVVRLKETSSCTRLSSINRVLSDGPVITEDLFTLALWMASYYGTPIEKVLRTMLPSGVRKATQVKKQYLVKRQKTRDELSLFYRDLAEKAPQQAKILEILLQTKKGILLSELLESAECHASSVKALVEKGVLSLDLVRSQESIIKDETYFTTPPKVLREEQQRALDSILLSLTANRFSVKLLYGITGSGKTEVFIRAIEACLAQGKGILVLVPEIALTTQTIQRFKSRFTIPIAVLHHRLSDGERHEAWTAIRTEGARIVIGARSAVFCPIPNLGLIIVDEEHEHSYKQTDDSPSYHARDVAVMRGKLNNATVLLGSATPSLESYYNAAMKKYELLTLAERSASAMLPDVHIVDMRREFDKAKGFTLFSDLLLQKIDERRAKGEQAMLFLNRRGFHTTSTCTECGKVLMCTKCDCALTFHKLHNTLSCHLCGFDCAPPSICPNCRKPSLIRYGGIGTEKVEAALYKIFPEIRVLRADADSTKHKGSLEKILNDFRTGKADVLVGTQMIAKGLHFPEVTLVGILNCDTTLNIPDFRAQESVFQLITQVAGRSGRGITKGEVILQTSLPDHPTILAASRQDYPAFYAEEVETRKLFAFPPYNHIIKFVFSGTDQKAVEESARSMGEALQKELPAKFTCHPALPCGHPKVNERWRYQCLVRGPSVSFVTSLAERLDKELRRPSCVSFFCDVDPISTFF